MLLHRTKHCSAVEQIIVPRRASYFSDSFVYLVKVIGRNIVTEVNTMDFGREGRMKLFYPNLALFFVRHLEVNTRLEETAWDMNQLLLTDLNADVV